MFQAARATPSEGRFTAVGQQFQRCRQGDSGRVFAIDLATGGRRDLTFEEEAAFWSWATVKVLRHTGIRIEEMLELTHHSFVAYTLPTTGEVVPMLQIAPSKTDAERLLLVSPELAEVLTAIIFRVRAGNAALPLVSAYDVFEQTWSPPMPYLFQRRFGTEDRPLTRSYIRECLVAMSQAGNGGRHVHGEDRCHHRGDAPRALPIFSGAADPHSQEEWEVASAGAAVMVGQTGRGGGAPAAGGLLRTSVLWPLARVPS
ncbi:hypothetical protein [Saccharopolyspora sp. ASAGF58]|uniref:hypothetical protein n=1 Tax=Saccharopolyspora sp. ASAGF58 TaxID=2719023 RepID=UPI001B30896D|nr:hypothetical protein [Saccharopolyspora sp. ASAGF58]